MKLSEKDREILRDLARRQAELAHSREMEEILAAWKAHGRFAPDKRPMVTIETQTFSQDIIPPLLRCEGEEARGVEWTLQSNLVNHTLFGDDTVVLDYLPVRSRSWFEPFALPVQRENAADSAGERLGHHFIPQLRDLQEDFHKLNPSGMGVDREGARRTADVLEDLLGDILPVRHSGGSINLSPMQNIVHIMSMEDMFCAMYDYPDLFHSMMEMQTGDMLAYLDMLEREELLLPTTGAEHLCQGSYCFTDELPQVSPCRCSDVWGYLDSQETSGVSPQMYEEFVYPYYTRLAARFGLLSYGCCEAVHSIWDQCVSRYPGLKKVSISPWCDEEYMGQQLRGKKIVYLRKPSPNLIGVGTELDEEAVRDHIRATARAASGCTLEIAQRDVYHIHNTPNKVRRYVELIRQCCADTWKT